MNTTLEERQGSFVFRCAGSDKTILCLILITGWLWAGSAQAATWISKEVCGGGSPTLNVPNNPEIPNPEDTIPDTVCNSFTPVTFCDWGDAANWTDENGNAVGSAPPTTLNGDLVIIRHRVRLDDDLTVENGGAVHLVDVDASDDYRPVWHINDGKNVLFKENTELKVFNGDIQQWRFTDGCGVAPDGSTTAGLSLGGGSKHGGSFKTSGTVEVVGAHIEVTQDWAQEGGSRYHENTCVKTGQNFSISGGAGVDDTLIGFCGMFGGHGSGNMQFSNEGTNYFDGVDVLLEGGSGEFQFSKGFYTGTFGPGFSYAEGPSGWATSSGVTPGSRLHLGAYCLFTTPLTDDGNIMEGPQAQTSYGSVIDRCYNNGGSNLPDPYPFPCECTFGDPGAPPLALEVTATSGSFCPGDAPVQLNASASGGFIPSGSGGYSFSWSPATGLSNDSIANPTASPASTTLYTVTVTDEIGNTASATAQISTDNCTGSIGDYVWLDENSDGIQDAGEAGIPNVKVELYDSLGTTLIATTYTDASGGYIFKDQPSGDYVVKVDTTTLATGLQPVSDEDDPAAGGGADTANESAVTLIAGTEYTTADFSYNWVSYTDVNNPAAGATGAIGDRLWNDANGDGVQDPNEVGLEGVTVKLLVDTNGDGIYGGTGDDPAVTTTTDANGNYIFDGLAPGSYVIEVDETTLPTSQTWTQTGDPDATLDGQTTSPIVLAPGDAFVNADFGYQPDYGFGNSIGDSVWLDANGDGVRDYDEPGIGGVEIQVTWYGADDTLGTADDVVYLTTTDENGNYLIDNLPDGDYEISTDGGAGPGTNFDSGGALEGLTQTYDFDGTVSAHKSTITDLGVGVDAPVAALDQDFAYSPSDGVDADGVIGDTIFFDANGNGVPDEGEGIPGVKVTVSDGTNNYIVYSDAYGNWAVGDLPAGSYTVTVDTSTLPGGGAGLINTIDPDGSGDNTSTVILPTDDSVNLDQDFGYTGTDPFTNSIGDIVWLDADRNGMINDSEAGIPGVLVQATWYGADDTPGTADDVVYLTTTDENGNYLFDNLPSGEYVVTTNLAENYGTGGPLNGLYDSYDKDGGTVTPDGTTAQTLTGNQDVDDIDFGLSPSDGTGNEGVIGDTIYWDANGNGQPDPGEGLPGVKVELTGGVITYTDANGNYYFGNLDAGMYTVSVDTNTLPGGHADWTNTVDPDSAPPDDESTVTLPTADSVDLEQDFGYQPTANGTIGDTIWMDADRDGVVDANETGIAGVTVALIQDSNGNGVWDAGEPIIATTESNENGFYSFVGLSLDDGGGDGDADYLVWVNDTDNVLGELEATSDHDGTAPATGVVSGLGISSTRLRPANPDDQSQDFGYSPTGHLAGEGLIGDKIFLDADGSDSFTEGDTGIEGVVVKLYDSTGTTLVAEPTTTDENGNYSFGGLDPAETYTVRIDTSTLPGTGLLNSVDPDGGLDSESQVDLSSYTGGIALDQDFGFKTGTPNTVGGTIWEDANADGMLTAGAGGTPNETDDGIAGVTVALYEDSNGNGVLDGGDALIGTTTTDSKGDYSFTGVPNGTYFVDVTDESGVLNGFWHSDGPSDGSDNNSQDDPYQVTLTGNNTNTTADFGYYSEPSAIEGIVFFDSKGAAANGVYGESNDVLFAGVEVTLTIEYPSGDTVTLVTTTDINGYYSFENLLLDETFDGDDGTADASNSGTGNAEPSYTVSIDMSQTINLGVLSDFYATSEAGSSQTPDNLEIRGAGVIYDADQVAGTMALPEMGYRDDTNDFGLSASASSTRVSIDQFEAFTMRADEVIAQLAPDRDTALAMLARWAPDLAANMGDAGYEAVVNELFWAMDPDGNGSVALLRWQTLEERGTIGFYAERRRNGEGGWQRVNLGDMLPGLIDAPLGGEYLLFDPYAEIGEHYDYRLIEVEVWGRERPYGPWQIVIPDVAQSGAIDLASDIEQTEVGEREFEAWTNLDRGYAGRARKVKAPKKSLAEPDASALASVAGSEVVGMRFLTRTEGLFAVPLADMAVLDTGKGKNRLASKLNRGSMALTAGGSVVPYHYDDEAEVLYFAGSALRTRDTVTNVYNLADGEGVSMNSKGGKKPRPAGLTGVFTDSLRFERNTGFAAGFMMDETADTGYYSFVWAPFIPQRALPIELPDVAPGGTATVRINLRGALDEGPGDDHSSRLLVNGVEVGAPVTWNGFDTAVLDVSFDQALLASVGPGLTTVTLTVVQEGLVNRSLALIESIEIDYQRETRAFGDELWLHGVTGIVTVTGFSSGDVAVIESPVGGHPVWRQDVRIEPSAVAGDWQVTFEADEPKDFLLSALPDFPVIQANYSSELMDSGAGVEYLVIAPDALLAGANALANHRSAQFTTGIARLQDIFDAYSYGRVDSEAIRLFLADVRETWITVPSYVVLLGRGTQDHLDDLGYGESLLPIKLASTPWGLASSDSRYADVNGDRIPEFRLGRISVSDDAALQTYVAKLQAYDQETWPAGSASAVVSDNSDSAGAFRANSDAILAMLEEHGYVAQDIYHPDVNVRSVLQAGWVQGDYPFVNYEGHGGKAEMGNTAENFLLTSDVVNLINSPMPGNPALPIVAALTCSVGDSTAPGILGLVDELVLSPDGGAIAAFAPSGQSWDAYAHVLNKGLIDYLFGSGDDIGTAHQGAIRNAVENPDPLLGVMPEWMLDIYQVEGDPAVKIAW